jgi:hypothetical protein
MVSASAAALGQAMRSIVLASVLAVPVTAAAHYESVPLQLLVLSSDAIVSGEIVALSSRTFVLRVDEHAFGPVTAGRTMRVHRFQNWPCASRWARYAVGQRVVLSLQRERDGSWQIQSSGGEGEMPVDGDRVFVSPAYSALAPAGVDVYAQHSVHGGAYAGFSLSRAELLAAVRAARACYRPSFAHGQYGPLSGVAVSCSEAELRALQRTPLGAALAAAMHL